MTNEWTIVAAIMGIVNLLGGIAALAGIVWKGGGMAADAKRTEETVAKHGSLLPKAMSEIEVLKAKLEERSKPARSLSRPDPGEVDRG